MSTQGEFREWRPGDGLTCRFARQAPLEIPCGRPVRTAIQTVSTATRPDRVQAIPLCENHADFGMPAPHQLLNVAKRAAQEALTVAHWTEYQSLLKAEIDRRVDEARTTAGLPSLRAVSSA